MFIVQSLGVKTLGILYNNVLEFVFEEIHFPVTFLSYISFMPANFHNLCLIYNLIYYGCSGTFYFYFYFGVKVKQ